MATWCRLHAQYRLTQFVILWLAIGVVHVFPLEQLFCSSQNTELIYHGGMLGSPPWYGRTQD
jgi:hypothetical protein